MTEETKPLVLLVDDDSQIRGILAIKIKAAGLDVAEAENGQEAIDKAKKQKPDVIIMDVRMPIMSGTEAVTIIKNDPQLKDIKIIFFSNFGEDDELDAWLDQKYAKEMGAFDYVKKTDNLAQIIEKIKEVLAQ